MRKYFLIASAIWVMTNLSAQNFAADSTVFAQTQWATIDLDKGLVWQHFHFSAKQLFNSNQNINLLRLKSGRRNLKISFISGGDSLILTSKLATQNGAKAAVNGSFFDVKNGGAVDFIRIDGQVLDTTVLANGRRTFHQMSAIVLHKNKLRILRGDSTDKKWDEKLPYKNVMVTGPLLMLNGKNAPLSEIVFNDNRHPRTCACVTEKREVILMTVDGRTAESQGINLHEATNLMRWLGCRDAINLDGGGSTTLFIEGQNVVNMPCDNKKFDHEGERRVSNIIVIK